MDSDADGTGRGSVRAPGPAISHAHGPGTVPGSIPTPGPIPGPNVDSALAQQRELDRKRLHLHVLLETSRELSGMLQPRAILETFLLTAMGPLGAVRGVAVLARPGSAQGLVASRGLPKADAEALEGRLPDICDLYFPYRDALAGSPAAKVRVLARGKVHGETPPPGGESILPAGLDILLTWGVDEEHCGLLALGPRLVAEQGQASGGAAGQDSGLASGLDSGLDEDAADLLQNLVHILIDTLRGALAVNSIRQLSNDLTRQNERLAEALSASQSAQRGLDRRVFQLAAINELAGELSNIQAVREILDRFLLTMLGAFGAASGLALVLDRAAGSVSLALRGATDPGLAGYEAADTLVYKAFAGSGVRSVAPLTVGTLADPATALKGGGLPFAPSAAVYFALSPQVQGVLVLGPCIAEGDGADTGRAAQANVCLGEADQQLLRAQVAALLGYVRGARHLETITALNADLTRRNEELTRTITELTEARQTIVLLERAGERVRAFLRNEAERSRRFSWLNCGVILATATLLALLFNLASPGGVSLIPEHLRQPPAKAVSAQKARELVETEGALIVDARPQAFYDQKRIRGAVNLTPSLFDMGYLMRFGQMPLGTPIIVYGGNISRRWDQEVAARLLAREHERVLVLDDGLAAWSGRGYPVEP